MKLKNILVMMMILCVQCCFTPIKSIAAQTPTIELVMCKIDEYNNLKVSGILHSGLSNWTLGIAGFYPKTDSSDAQDKVNFYYNDQTETTLGENGECPFAFAPHLFPGSAKSGTYTVVISGQGLNTVTATFKFAGSNEQKTVMEEVRDASGDDIAIALEKLYGDMNYAQILGVVDTFNDFKTNLKAKKNIAEAILDQSDNNFDVSGMDPSTEEGQNSILQKVMAFRFLFMDAYKIASLGDADTSDKINQWLQTNTTKVASGSQGYDARYDFNGNINAATGNTILDNELKANAKAWNILSDMEQADKTDNGTRGKAVYEGIRDANLISDAIPQSWIPSSWEIRSLEDYNLSSIRNGAREQVLLKMIKSMPWQYMKDCVTSNSQLFNIDLDTFNKLSEANKDEVFKLSLSGRNFANLASFKTEFENQSLTKYENQNEPTSGGGNTTNNRSGSSGNIAVAGTIPSQISEKKPDQIFSDVNSVPWAQEAIIKLVDMDVLKGRGEGVFAPDESITRAEFVKILMSALGFKAPEESNLSTFTDININDWYYGYVAVAQQFGIVNGKEDGSFGAEDNITRQDMAALIYRAVQIAGRKLDTSGEKILFIDYDNIDSYSKLAVDALSSAKIINGMEDGSFNPKGLTTRAQAAKVVYSIIK